MSRDHHITGSPYVMCDICGLKFHKNQTILHNGMRICRRDFGHPGPEGFIPPPPATWDEMSVRQHRTEYGVLVWMEEFGLGDTKTEYGVVVDMRSDISGEYGTLVYVPDHREWKG